MAWSGPTYPEYSRVTGILSFYDEPIDSLIACVSSMAGVVDHLIAVDGAYMHYPDGKPASDPNQMKTIAEVCRGARIGLTAHTPTAVWGGNEVMKRNYTLRLAELVTNPGGWYIVLDADCVVTKVSETWFEDVHKITEEGYGVISVGVREVRQLPIDTTPNDTYTPIRLMYRAVRGMEYGPAHFNIHVPPVNPEVDKNWQCLWCDRHPANYLADAYDGTHLIKVDHVDVRSRDRNLKKRKYYAVRDRLNLERNL